MADTVGSGLGYYPKAFSEDWTAILGTAGVKVEQLYIKVTQVGCKMAAIVHDAGDRVLTVTELAEALESGKLAWEIFPIAP